MVLFYRHSPYFQSLPGTPALLNSYSNGGQQTGLTPQSKLRYESSTPTSQKLSSSICQSLWVRDRWHLTKSPPGSIYKGIMALYWPSTIKNQPVTPYTDSVPPSTNHCWPNTQLHHFFEPTVLSRRLPSSGILAMTKSVLYSHELPSTSKRVSVVQSAEWR